MQLRQQDLVDSDVDMEMEASGDEESSHDDADQQTQTQLKKHRLPITCLCIDSDDKFAYTASKDGSIIKWCLTTWKILNKVYSIKKSKAKADKKLEARHHVNHINAIAISSDDKFLATGGWDKKVRIWSPDSLKWVHTFTLHRQEITALAFRRGHHTLYSGSADRSVMLWALEDDDNRCFVESLIGHESPITSMDASRKERVLTSGGRDQTLRIWKIVEQAQTVFQTSHQSVDVARYIDDKTFVSGGEDGNITLWTTMKHSSLCTVKAHARDQKTNQSCWVTSLATYLLKKVKPPLKKSDEPPTKRWKVENEDEDNDDDDNEEGHSDEEEDGENELEKVAQEELTCEPLALVASGSCDSKLHIWRVLKNNLELQQSFECPGFINDLKFTSDGRRVIAACGTEHRFGRWSVKKGAKNCLRVFELNK